jgi:hypothetical protein
MNPIQKYINTIVYPAQFNFFAAAIAAAATVAATAYTIASSESSADAGQAAAAKAGENAAGITNDQMNELRKARDNANKYQLPYYDTGTNAQNKLGYMMGLGNTVETPVDNSVGVFLGQKQAQLQQHLASKPDAKNKAALKKWQTQKQNINNQIKDIKANGESSTFYNKWNQNQPQTKKVELPIDSTYGSLLKDFSAEDFQVDPGYQFRKDQGNKAIDNKLAAMGGVQSGLALKDAMTFNQGLAAQEYQGAFDRYMTQKGYKTNTLFNMAGTGQRAADNISQNNNQFGANVSNALAQKGQAQQDAIYQGANAKIAGNTGTANAVGSIGKGISAIAGYNSGMKTGYGNTGVDSSAWGA